MPLTQELLQLGEQFLPWPEGGLTFRAPDPLPHGLRLSQDCPSRRIIEHFDDEREAQVTAGVSLAGHLYADLFIQSLLPNGDGFLKPETSVEYEIPWLDDGMATTSLDAVVWDGPLAAHYEFKTSSSKSPTPSAANRRQVIRQRAAAHLALEELPPTSVIYIIGKSGHTSCFVYGPFEIIPTESEWANTLEELGLTRLIVADILRGHHKASDHPLLASMCCCTWCFPVPIEDADDQLIELVDGVFAGGIDDYKFARRWYDEIREDVRKLVAPGESRETPGGWIIKHSEKGILRIERG